MFFRAAKGQMYALAHDALRLECSHSRSADEPPRPRSITAVNNGLSDFKGNVLFCSHDYEIVNTVANRIIEICDDGVIDHSGNYDDFVEFKESRGMEVTTL